MRRRINIFRLQAELANIPQNEIKKKKKMLCKVSLTILATELLPVIDNLERLCQSKFTKTSKGAKLEKKGLEMGNGFLFKVALENGRDSNDQSIESNLFNPKFSSGIQTNPLEEWARNWYSCKCTQKGYS